MERRDLVKRLSVWSRSTLVNVSAVSGAGSVLAAEPRPPLGRETTPKKCAASAATSPTQRTRRILSNLHQHVRTRHNDIRVQVCCRGRPIRGSLGFVFSVARFVAHPIGSALRGVVFPKGVSNVNNILVTTSRVSRRRPPPKAGAQTAHSSGRSQPRS